MAEELLRYSLDLSGSLSQGSSGKDNNIRLFFFDYDGKKVENITIAQAEVIAKLDSEVQFYYVNGDGETQETSVADAKKLDPIKSTTPSKTGESSCSQQAGPQTCGPPKVVFDLNGPGIKPQANVIVSPVSSSIIAVDVINNGAQMTSTPRVNFEDQCGNGDGASGKAIMQPSPTNPNRQEVVRVVITSPGNGYIPSPNGSTGGSGRVFTSPGECYVKTVQGTYYPVLRGANVILNDGDELICPQPPTTTKSPEFTSPNPFIPSAPSPPSPGVPRPATQQPTYKVALQVDTIEVFRPGFGYKPTDEIVIEPSNGAVLKPIYTETGELNRVEVLNPGIGFDDFPLIYIESDSGYNAEIVPVFKAIREEDIPVDVPKDITLISVVDCVGKV